MVNENQKWFRAIKPKSNSLMPESERVHFCRKFGLLFVWQKSKLVCEQQSAFSICPQTRQTFLLSIHTNSFQSPWFEMYKKWRNREIVEKWPIWVNMWSGFDCFHEVQPRVFPSGENSYLTNTQSFWMLGYFIWQWNDLLYAVWIQFTGENYGNLQRTVFAMPGVSKGIRLSETIFRFVLYLVVYKFKKPIGASLDNPNECSIPDSLLSVPFSYPNFDVMGGRSRQFRTPWHWINMI